LPDGVEEDTPQDHLFGHGDKEKYRQPPGHDVQRRCAQELERALGEKGDPHEGGSAGQPDGEICDQASGLPRVGGVGGWPPGEGGGAK